MPISKLGEPTLLADQVYAKLHAAIVNGEMPAGSRLRVRDLAAQVGTSVMPVREAIRRLEEAGLAQREPHKGAVVHEFALQDLVHVYDLRLLLEREAARMGAARIDDAACRRMATQFDLMRAALDDGRVIDYLDRDEELLALLYESGGNPVLVSTIRTLWQHCRAYKIMGARSRLGDGAVADHSLWRHQDALVAAARRGDPDTAAAVTEASLQDATARIRDELLQSRQRA